MNHPEDHLAFWLTIACALDSLFLLAPALQSVVDRGGLPVVLAIWATVCSAALLLFAHLALPLATVLCSLRPLASALRPLVLAALGLAAENLLAPELEQALQLFLSPELVAGARFACEGSGIASLVALFARSLPPPP